MKKIISFIIAAIMAIGICPTAFAEVLSEGLKAVIINVKEKINIPEEYSEFDYSVDNYNGQDEYTLIWKSKGKDEEDKAIYRENQINVTIDGKGNILNYNNFDAEEEELSISKQKSKKECVDAAEGFLKQIFPNNYSDFKLEKNEQNKNFLFKYYKNNVPVKFGNAQINLNRDTLNIVNFSCENADYIINGKFEDTAGIISSEQAANAFIDNIKFEPEYSFYYDYKTGKSNVFLTYNGNIFYNKSVDAKTEDLIEPEDYGLYDYGRTELALENNSAKDATGGDNYLTEEELSKIDEVKNFVSKDVIEKEIKNIIPSGLDFGKLERSGLSADRVDKGKYVWDFEYEKGHISVNAKTKELISFYVYSKYEQDISKDISTKKIKAAEDYIKKVSPAKFSNVELSKEESDNVRLRFVRKVNGYDFPENNIDIMFDENDNIISYVSYWYDSVKFPNPSSVIDKKTAFENVKKSGNLGLSYEIFKNGDDKIIVLAYSFINSDNMPGLIDAQTGKRLNYDGTEYKEVFKAPESYSDISGHWCEEYVNKLKEQGIYVKREKFLPNEKITKGEFFEYYQVGGFSEKLKAFKDSKEFITRKEICLIISEILKYEKLTDKDVFKNVFSDVEETDENFGDIAAANAMGIVTANSAGKFFPDRELTNAEAAKIIYSLEELR